MIGDVLMFTIIIVLSLIGIANAHGDAFMFGIMSSFLQYRWYV